MIRHDIFDKRKLHLNAMLWIISLKYHYFQAAYTSFAPNLIANYSYQLAQSFNEFYHTHHVLGSPEEAFRLQLVKATSQVLKNSLSLLGISILEKM